MISKPSCICRGENYVYIEFAIDGLNEECTLKAFFNGGGYPIPIPLNVCGFREGGESCVCLALVPMVDFPSFLTIAVLNVEGGSLDKRRIDIRPHSIKWKSRWNYRVHQKQCASIRTQNIEPINSANITIEKLYEDGNEIVITGMISTDYQLDENAVMHCLWSNGVYSAGAPTFLRDKANCNNQHQPREFFLRLPKGRGGLYCFLADGNDNFHCIPTFFGEARMRALVEDYRAISMNASKSSRYLAWTKSHFVSSEEIDRQRSDEVASDIGLSVVIDWRKRDIVELGDVFGSIAGQTRNHFETIILCAQPVAPDAERLLAGNDQEVRIVGLSSIEHRGISIVGDFIDDLSGNYLMYCSDLVQFEPDMFYECATSIARNHTIDFIYWDEDRFDGSGFAEPYFKTDYNSFLLQTQNYIGSSFLMGKELFKKCELQDKEFGVAECYRFVLDACSKADNICHIERVLSHVVDKPVESAEILKVANVEMKEALEEHLRRKDIDCLVRETSDRGYFNVSYAPKRKSKVGIIIPNKDAVDLLDTCLKSLYHVNQYQNFSITVIENNSTDSETFRYYELAEKEHGNLKVLKYEGGFNFSSITNYAVEHTEEEYLLFLNNDTEVIAPLFLSDMLGVCQQDNVGIVGARLWYKNGSMQHGGVCVWDNGGGHHLNVGIPRSNTGYFHSACSTQNFSAVTAACMLTKRSVFNEVQGFSESLQQSFGDVDYCLKVRSKGYDVVYDSNAELYHYESVTRGREDTAEKVKRERQEIDFMHNRWPQYYLGRDPYFNRNLNRETLNYDLGE